MEIEEIYEILVAHRHGDKIGCPKCDKSGFVFCLDRPEERRRYLFFCLHCDFVCDDPEELKEL